MLIDEDKSPEDYEEIIEAYLKDLVAAQVVIMAINARLDVMIHPYGDKSLPKWTERQSIRELYGEDIVDDIERILALSPTDALQAVKAATWDEGNAVSNSSLPRCPFCDDRPVSMHRRGGLNEWRHDDDGTVICGGSFTGAVHVDLNPYRAAAIVSEPSTPREKVTDSDTPAHSVTPAPSTPEQETEEAK